jgi:hypothetical protein
MNAVVLLKALNLDSNIFTLLLFVLRAATKGGGGGGGV